MLGWLSANISTIVIGAVLLAIIVSIVYCLVKNKRQGKSSCGCGCSTCALNGKCHK